ncbi:MAG: hypothetical protein KC619_35240 [Myxococcales bacterium]|nr:hypothetical protein [Myxococcales bacterium]
MAHDSSRLPIALAGLLLLAPPSLAHGQSSEPEDISFQRPTPTEARAETDVSDALRTRQTIADVHRGFGIATWIAMTGTLVMGFIHLSDEYGFFAAQPDTPCARGNAVFQDFCTGPAIPHAIAGFTTLALYGTTFGLSFAMPDPLGVGDAEGAFSDRLRVHKVLRWVHLAGMVLQTAIGIAISFMDTNDYDTRRALAGVHLGTGLVTWGALTTAAALVIF